QLGALLLEGAQEPLGQRLVRRLRRDREQEAPREIAPPLEDGGVDPALGRLALARQQLAHPRELRARVLAGPLEDRGALLLRAVEHLGAHARAQRLELLVLVLPLAAQLVGGGARLLRLAR